MKKLLIIFNILFIFSATSLHAYTYNTTEKQLYSDALKKIENQDYAAAKENLNKLIQINSNNSDYYYAISIVFANSDDFENSLKYLNKTLYLAPNHTDALYNRALIYYKQNEKKKAILDLNKILSINPINGDALYLRAQINQDLGNFNDAIDDYYTYLYKYNASPLVFLKRAEAYYSLGRYKDAITNANNAISYAEKAKNTTKEQELENKNTIIMAYNIIAISQKKFGWYQKAIDNLNMALSFNNSQYANGLYCNRGEMYFFLKDYKTALADFNKTIEIDPNFAEAYYYRSLIQNELGKTKEAEIDFQKAKALGFTEEDIAKNQPPKDIIPEAQNPAKNYEFTKEVYLENGNKKIEEQEDYEGAIKDYNMALEIDPIYVDAYIARGIANFEVANSIKGEKDFNTAIALNPKNPEVYYLLGLIESKRLNRSAALDNFNEVIKLNPNNANAYYNIALENFYLNNNKEIMENLNKVFEINPNYAEAYILLGKTKTESKQYQEALKDFDKAIKINPKAVNAYIERAYTKYKMKSYKEALSDLNKAIELDPKNNRPYFIRSDIYFSMGETEKSKQDMKKHTSLFHIDYAKKWIKFGLYDEAIKSLQKSLESIPDNPDAYLLLAKSYEKIVDKSWGPYKNLPTELKNLANTYQKLIQIQPNTPENYFKLAATYAKLHEYLKSIYVLENLITLLPNNEQAYLEKAKYRMLYIIQQQEIVTDDIDDSNSILALGISFINKKISDIDNTKEYKKIIEDYTKALSINKENADTYNKRGLIEKGLKQYQEALQDFDNAVKFDKDNNKEYYFNRGEIKIFLGQGKESISDFDKAIEIDPKYAQAYYYRAAQYQTIGQKAKAKADFKKAKELGYISKSEEDRDLLLATIVALIIIAGIHFITKIPSKKIF